MPETPPNAATCQFITFYSYKGGTGRSMLLANVAWLLACNGERVLIIDWDLEAPGVHRFFHPFLTDKALTSTEGLIDGLSHFVEAAVSSPGSTGDSELSQPDVVDDPDWYKLYANLQSYAVPINWSFQGRGKLDLIGAGRQGPMYGTKVNLFDWRQFYTDFAGREFLNAAKDLLREKYDYVLIDSRTGVSDTSGICTTQMPDTLVVCFTLNNQSIEGAYSVAAGASQVRSSENKLSVVPVPTRVDPFESEKVELGRELSRVRFQSLVPMDKLSHSASEEKQIQQYWGDVEVPYVPKYAYEEVLACFSDMPHLKSSVLSSSEQVARLLRGKLTEMVPVPEDVRKTVLNQFARKPYRVALAESYAERLNAPDLDQLRKVLVRLVQVATLRASTVVDVPCPGFLSDFSDEELAMLQQAKEHNLVVFLKDPGGNDIVKLIDERLILGWPRLAEWIDSDRAFLSWLPELTRAFKTWTDSGMEPDDLLTGTSLAQAARWLQARRKDLRPGEIDFIEKCQASDEALRAAAETEIKNFGLQRKVQTLQAHKVREELEAKDRELEEATAAYQQLSDSVRTTQRSYAWASAVGVIGIVLSLAAAYFAVQKHRSKPLQQVTETQVAPIPKGPDPSSETNAIPAIDTGSDTAAVQKDCKGVSVNLYANSISDLQTRAALTTLWQQHYNLQTKIIIVGSRQQPANSIWHGSNVSSSCWKVVAFSLMRAGFFVSDLGAPEHDTTGKHLSIDIGYSARGLSLPPVSRRASSSANAPPSAR